MFREGGGWWSQSQLARLSFPHDDVQFKFINSKRRFLRSLNSFLHLNMLARFRTRIFLFCYFIEKRAGMLHRLINAESYITGIVDIFRWILFSEYINRPTNVEPFISANKLSKTGKWIRSLIETENLFVHFCPYLPGLQTESISIR